MLHYWDDWASGSSNSATSYLLEILIYRLANGSDGGPLVAPCTLFPFHQNLVAHGTQIDIKGPVSSRSGTERPWRR